MDRPMKGACVCTTGYVLSQAPLYAVPTRDVLQDTGTLAFSQVAAPTKTCPQTANVACSTATSTPTPTPTPLPEGPCVPYCPETAGRGYMFLQTETDSSSGPLCQYNTPCGDTGFGSYSCQYNVCFAFSIFSAHVAKLICSYRRMAPSIPL